MRGHTYATREEAERSIRAIDAARPEFETLTTIVDGRVVTTRQVPALTWGEPFPLRDGTWAVVWSDRKLASIDGRSVQVDGQKATCPRAVDAVTIAAANLPARAEAADGDTPVKR